MTAICAVPAERRALRPLVGPRLRVLVSGMGPVAARRTARQALADPPSRALLAVGFCGALSADLRVGDLVAGMTVRGPDGRSFAADPALLQASGARGVTMVSTGSPARTPTERSRLAGDAVDMESAAVACEAARAGLPFLALRAVTDARHHRLPDLAHAIDATGRVRPPALLLHLLAHPADLVRTARLAWGSWRAGRALRRGVAGLLDRLPAQP